MDVTLEAPVFAGGAAFAALSRTDVLRHRAGCVGSKKAVALLVRHDAELRAFTPRGREMTADEVEALCPGALARFAEMAAQSPD